VKPEKAQPAGIRQKVHAVDRDRVVHYRFLDMKKKKTMLLRQVSESPPGADQQPPTGHSTRAYRKAG
jgi:hypothetical protein